MKINKVRKIHRKVISKADELFGIKSFNQLLQEYATLSSRIDSRTNIIYDDTYTRYKTIKTLLSKYIGEVK